LDNLSVGQGGIVHLHHSNSADKITTANAIISNRHYYAGIIGSCTSANDLISIGRLNRGGAQIANK
jgi:hypothetical protein